MFCCNSDFCLLPAAFCLWNRVMAATTPWITTADSVQCEVAASDRTMRLHRFNRVLQTSRRKTAAAGRTEDKNLRGRNRPAIRADGEHQNMLGWIHGCFSKPARR